MKIFLRPETTNDEQISLSWPRGFENFVQSQLSPFHINSASRADEQIILPHGILDARVIFTREKPLASAWRVAAYHSNVVSELAYFDANSLSKADGIVVKGENFYAPLAIATADCLAVAVTSEVNGRIQQATCFHAGWRGYCGGIQQVALNWMKNQRSLPQTSQNLELSDQRDSDWPKNLHVTIGPAIAGCSYPCGPDVEAALTEHLIQRLRPHSGWTSEHDFLFASAVHANEDPSRESDKIFPDLQVLMVLELSALGVPLEQISILREDTFSSRWWPSHRRARSQGLEKAGRLITHLCPSSCP